MRHRKEIKEQVLLNPKPVSEGLSIAHIRSIPLFKHITEEEAMRICILLRLLAIAVVSVQNRQESNEILVAAMTVAELKEIIIQCVEESLPNKTPIPVFDNLLKRKEVAKLFGVSLVTINEWMRSGLLPFHRLNSRVYFKRHEVMEALNRRDSTLGKRKKT